MKRLKSFTGDWLKNDFLMKIESSLSNTSTEGKLGNRFPLTGFLSAGEYLLGIWVGEVGPKAGGGVGVRRE